jgi:hypothetical protein
MLSAFAEAYSPGIWDVLHFDFSGSTPLTLYGWPHETSPEALARNAAGLQILSEFRGPLMPVAQSYAERNGLEIDWSNPAATVSKLAVITQTPREFDFPIPHLPQKLLSKTSALTAWPGTTKVHEVDRRMNKSCN